MVIFLERTINKATLKWLMHAILVFGLITFSGHYSPSKSCGFEPTRTELTQRQAASPNHTVGFKTIEKGSTRSTFFHNSVDHYFNACHYELKAVVKFKSLRSNLTVNKENERQFLIYFYTRSSDVPDNHIQRG